MSQLFASGGQSIGASASTIVLSMNIQGWFSLGLSGLTSLQSKGLSRVLSSTTIWKHQFFGAQPFLWSNCNFNFCFIDYAKAFDCVDHNKLWKILKEMGIPDLLTFLLTNLYAGQEAIVRTGPWNNRLVPNRKRSTSRLYIVTLLI